MFAAQRPAAQRPTAWQALVVALECRVITHLQAASMDAMSKSHRGAILPPTIDDLSLSFFIPTIMLYHIIWYSMIGININLVQHHLTGVLGAQTLACSSAGHE